VKSINHLIYNFYLIFRIKSFIFIL